MLRINKKIPVIQVGICRTENQIEAVWFDGQRRPQRLSADIREIAAVPQRIAEQQSDLPDRFKFKFISAAPAHKVWSKTLILPHLLNEQECEQQCRYVLQNELPVPFDELWFDYCSTPLKQGLRLDIFAIIQRAAQSHLAQFSPLQIDVLDHAAHCLLRAFSYFSESGESAPPLYLYQDGENSIALRNKPHQLQLVQKTAQNLTALSAQYCESYNETAEHILAYSTLEPPQPPPDNWRFIDTDIPFIPLGAALWRQDLRQDEKPY